MKKSECSTNTFLVFNDDKRCDSSQTFLLGKYLWFRFEAVNFPNKKLTWYLCTLLVEHVKANLGYVDHFSIIYDNLKPTDSINSDGLSIFEIIMNVVNSFDLRTTLQILVCISQRNYGIFDIMVIWGISMIIFIIMVTLEQAIHMMGTVCFTSWILFLQTSLKYNL